MQEQSVTVAGISHRLPAPFFVLATQNPIEMEGTYPLPEAQLDRFLFKLRVRYPALEQLNEIIDRTTSSREQTVERVMTGAETMTARELEILRLLGRGDKIVEVADALEISYKTVANTTSLLKQKLGAKNHSDLIRIAVEMGLG